MSILNFSDKLTVLSIESSTSDQNLGSFNNGADARQLKHIKVFMYFDGQFSAEKLTLSITDSLTAPTVTYSSDTINVIDIDPLLISGTDFLGWVRFDFNKEWLDVSAVYYVYITSANYTESASKNINLVFDYPIPIYGTRLNMAQRHPVGMEIFCLEEG